MLMMMPGGFASLGSVRPLWHSQHELRQVLQFLFQLPNPLLQELLLRFLLGQPRLMLPAQGKSEIGSYQQLTCSFHGFRPQVCNIVVDRAVHLWSVSVHS